MYYAALLIGWLFVSVIVGILWGHFVVAGNGDYDA